MKRFLTRVIATLTAIAMLTTIGLLTLPTATASTGTTVSQTPMRYGETTITNANVAYVYSLLAQELIKNTPPEAIEVLQSRGVSVEEVAQAYELFISDHPECFWIGKSYVCSRVGGKVVSIKPDYSFLGTALATAREQLESVVENIMGDLPQTNNYDKALYLHDRLAAHVTYAFVGEHQTAYGALVDGKAVCAGYAAAYQLLLHRAGIDAWTVTGFSNKPGESIPIAHAWNVVWIEEGVCVYTDVTWDDGDAETFHGYFNLTKQEMEKDHEVSADTFVLPDCNHDGNSYFDYNHCTVNDTTTMQQLAALFGPARDGQRDAVLYYQGTNINAFIERLRLEQNDLYIALDCGPGTCGYRLTSLSNEIHITVTGNFAKMTYDVTLNAPDCLQTYDAPIQYVEIGKAMQIVTYTARPGYYFPEDYAVADVNGLTVIRVDDTHITVSGTPIDDTTIALPAAAVLESTETPPSTSPETMPIESEPLSPDTIPESSESLPPDVIPEDSTSASGDILPESEPEESNVLSGESEPYDTNSNSDQPIRPQDTQKTDTDSKETQTPQQNPNNQTDGERPTYTLGCTSTLASYGWLGILSMAAIAFGPLRKKTR